MQSKLSFFCLVLMKKMQNLLLPARKGMFARETLVGCTPLAQPIAVYFVPSNREPASKQARFFRRWRRSACFPLLFNKTRRRRAICAANRRGTNKKRTSKRMSSFYCQAATIRIFLRRTPFPRPVNQRSVCRTKSEEQQNERTMSFYKKLVASDMTLVTSWCRWWDSNPHDVAIGGF